MAVLFVLDFDGGSTDDYDHMLERMGLGSTLPQGALFHGIGMTTRGLRAVDVWESDQAFQSFADTKIGPISAERGLAAPSVRRYEVTQLRGAADRPVTFLHLVTIPAMDRAGFEALDARVLEGVADLPDGMVFHVNGPAGDGQYVMDTWTSREQRDRFLEHNIKPAVAAAGVTSMPAFEDLELHNSLQLSQAARPAAV